MGPRFSVCATGFCIAFFFGSSTFAFAQSPFNGRCQATSTPLQVRAEGLTERLGEINLQCSGGADGSVLSGNLTIYLPVSVTNRVDANNLTSDALLLVDSGSGFVNSALRGQVSGNNISFYGISFPAPTGSIGLRISGIRGAIGQFGPATPQPVLASVSSSLPVDQAQLVVAYPQVALTTTLYSTGITCVGSPAPATLNVANLFAAGTSIASTRLTEGFSSAFEPRQPGADNGVRFLVKYAGFPANAHLYIPDAVAGSDALAPTAGGDLGAAQAVGQYAPGSKTLVLVRVSGADSTGSGGFAVSPPSGSGPQVLNSVSEVALTNGSGYAVYEVGDANPGIQETAQFPTFVTLPNVTNPATASETVSLAPVSTAAASTTTAPVVRFTAALAPSDCNALGDCNASYFPKLMADATPIQIGAIANGGPMTTSTGYITVRNASGGLLAWNVLITYQTGAGWLFVDNSSGIGNASVRVWSDTKSLNAGTYQATVTINAGAAGSQTIPLTLKVTAAPVSLPPPPAAPVPTISQVVNAATFGVTPVVPGSLATVIGLHLAGKNVSATFDGLAASILYAADGQLNLQVPAALGAKTSASVVVTVDGVATAPLTVALASAWPAIFRHGILDQDNRENAASSAARPGEVLQVFATGIPESASVAVRIGDLGDLAPLYAGAAPGISGVQQVNVALPASATDGPFLVLCATVSGAQPACSAPYRIAVH